MTPGTKSIAAATVASAIGLGVTVFWPEPVNVPAVTVPQVRVEGAAFIESSTNLTDWKPCATNVFVCTNAAEMFRGVASFALAWDDPHDANVASFVVKGGPTPGRWTWQTNCGLNTSVVVPAQWMTNYFAAFTEDAYGLQSEPSNVISVDAVLPLLTIKRL